MNTSRSSRRVGQASKGRRRGEVFPIRMTVEERARVEAMMRAGGPRSIGPWLLWRALSPAQVIPEQLEPPGRVLPELGITSSGNTAAATPVLRPSGIPLDKRLILDLCAGSGSWSQPYIDAGYRVLRVTLPAQDVRLFEAPIEPVWGVLAAPPCDQFSLARNGHPESPRDIERGLEVVGACLRVICAVRPRWWALENPVGLLSRWLGTPRDTFDPCDFGDPWTKRTSLWGDFAIPRRGPFVTPLGGGPLCEICDPERRRTTWCNNAAHRAITPKGFVKAFFEANP